MSNQTFNVSSVANFIQKSTSTVRKWTDEFSDFLSPSATPRSGEPRIYTEEDLAVFSLIQQMRDQGATPESITASLKNGQRGNVDIGLQLMLNEENPSMGLQLIEEKQAKIEQLQAQLSQTKIENAQLREQLKNAQKELTQIIRMALTQIKNYERQNTELQKANADLQKIKDSLYERLLKTGSDLTLTIRQIEALKQECNDLKQLNDTWQQWYEQQQQNN